MHTRQTIAIALMAFASIAKCQVSAMDDDTECSSTTAAAQPSLPAPTAPTSVVNSIFSPIASRAPDDSPDVGATFVFIDQPAPTASASAAPPPPPTQETTTEAASTAEATPTSDVAVPSSAPATPTEVAAPSSGSSSGQGLSGACAPDGVFNCVGGNQYQQCANGKWAPLIPLAAKCSEGQSMTLWRRDEDSDKGSFQSRRRAN
ncbi:hypothetical protein F4680DRAFT_333886 [Xylaria scruposa]|nr:hypothetical protein F4680DRAFT_333886 [Xylaria scruposa]